MMAVDDVVVIDHSTILLRPFDDIDIRCIDDDD
jgi:hypothetical protein